jgi:Protein of unknown function (DUF1553)/Protein of unknown function (DUF1549)/Planctomycete cytochrome C/Concanavalin A-like lectin/glucanases superfamily
MRTRITYALIGFLTVASGLLVSAGGPTAESRGFDATVAPILARRCLDCHFGPGAKGKLDLSTRASALAGGKTGPAIIPGKLDESPLWERINADEMPPKSPLPAAERAALRDWIAAGAPWGTDPIDPYQVTTSRRAGRDWWSLQPVRRPMTPAVHRAGWVRAPIDAFVLQKLEASGLEPAPEAEKSQLIRRLGFDLTGLPPTPEQVDEFLNDTSADAYERLVDRYFASPQYGVRWARWWLDLARYGESNGFEYDEFRPTAWRYRDWVVDALNRDRPYDEFARLQLAGDVLRPLDPGAVEATGFLVAGAYDTTGQNQLSKAMKAVVRSDELEDMIGTVSQTFLGLTVHCARCHDHKFDPVRQVEYYQIASALSGVRHGERDLSRINPEAVVTTKQIEALLAQVAAIEAPARARISARRDKALPLAPTPCAAWDFEHGLNDRIGSLNVSLKGSATATSEGLRLDGKTGYAVSASLPRELKAKTIEVWVRLDNLEQRGGGAITIQTPDGNLFDAIVFGEDEASVWMAGSDFFRRTRRVGGKAEKEAASRAVHLAITYSLDGTIRVFREGQPYGSPYRSPGPVTFPAAETEVVFGLRHSPAGGNKMLAGTIVRARVYDRALDQAEVAASAAVFGDYLDPGAIIAGLTPECRAERARLMGKVEKLRSSLADRARKAYAVAPREAGAMRVEIRGNPNQPGELVTAGGVAAIVAPGNAFGVPPDAPEALRRERLASWISSPQNPLFARVVVNRLWQAHFGAGLVEMTSDLGFNGGGPTHPGLLEWLAYEMAVQGWSIKSMHRLIVTSAAYRQSSRLDARGLERDAGDRLLWRKAPTRLEAEMVRDAMLAVSGILDPKLGGPSFRDHEVVPAAGTPAVLYRAVDPKSPGLNRRTLFRAWARGGRSALLDAFDCPDPSTTAPRRPVTTTPLQALSLMNNALVLYLSDAFAARLVREAGPDAGTQVDRAYRLALGRGPEPDERAWAERVVKGFGAATLARAIFNSNEFLYLD